MRTIEYYNQVLFNTVILSLYALMNYELLVKEIEKAFGLAFIPLFGL